MVYIPSHVEKALLLLLKKKQPYTISLHWKGETARLSPYPLPLKNRSNDHDRASCSYEYLPLSHYQTAGKAHEILHWDINSRFCSACGTPMEQKESIMKRCPKCGREVYPSISTAILVLVRKKRFTTLSARPQF